MVDTTNSEQYRDFVNDVAHSAQMPQELAEQLVLDTLRELGRAVSAGETTRLAAWLPPELAAQLTADSGQAKAIDERAFVDAVGAASGSTDPQTVEHQVRAVFAAVRGRVNDAGELRDTLAQLPAGLQNLFSDE